MSIKIQKMSFVIIKPITFEETDNFMDDHIGVVIEKSGEDKWKVKCFDKVWEDVETNRLWNVDDQNGAVIAKFDFSVSEMLICFREYIIRDLAGLLLSAEKAIENVRKTLSGVAAIAIHKNLVRQKSEKPSDN